MLGIRRYVYGKCVLLHLTFLIIVSLTYSDYEIRHKNYGPHRTTGPPLHHFTKSICMSLESTLRARHKSCFLRPDTGPCRADIIQWYYDVKQKKCFRFFWGGCQGNGNRFEKEEECMTHCSLNSSLIDRIPYFCSLTFDYGTCFGQYNRWAWDKFSKTCRRRLYSGCGGNQNNFETRDECQRNCLNPPNNTMRNLHHFTTCVPYVIPEIQ